MNQIILATHGGLAAGVRDTLSMVLGEAPNVHVVSLARDDTEPVSGKVEALLASFDPDDAVYVCTDMLGSSVNNEMVELASAHPGITVLSGMNMPLVLSLAVAGGPIADDELAGLVREARRGLRNCTSPEAEHAAAPAAKHAPSANKGPARIRLVRLDYRLVHGQVVFSWTNTLGTERIIVVDNAAAADEVKKGALKLAKPAGVRLNVFSVERALAKMDKLNTLGENVMMIFGNVYELLEFCQGYPKIAEINFGAAANHAGAIPVGGKDSSVFFDADERACAQKILDLGIKVYEQQTPTQTRTDISAL